MGARSDKSSTCTKTTYAAVCAIKTSKMWLHYVMRKSGYRIHKHRQLFARPSMTVFDNQRAMPAG